MKVCKIEGCNEKFYAKGHCQKHYKQTYDFNKILKRVNTDPNEIIIKGDIAEVVLYRGNKEFEKTIIDSEDVEKVKEYKWRLNSYGYVVTNQGIGIQHIIMGTNPNRKKLTDHKDRNKLNNKKSNFRRCTQMENNRNRAIQKNNTSGYRGVNLRNKKWQASIYVNYKRLYLGLFKAKINAAMAYNKAALKYHGEFACLNEV